MSLTDIITRVDAICKKYEKYDVDNHNDPIVSGEDVFARLYGVVEAETNATLQVCLTVSVCSMWSSMKIEKGSLLVYFFNVFSILFGC